MLFKPSLRLSPVLLFLLFLILQGQTGMAQTRQEAQASLLFYNAENLFDTINHPHVKDEERTPAGSFNWTAKKYWEKLGKISALFAQVPSLGKKGPSLIGICEVENASVLKDLVNTTPLSSLNYGWIHHDSPDHRGIDVALLYKKEDFLPLGFQAHRLLLFDEQGYRRYTRDQLVVCGYLGQEEIALLVVHWPSRSGGQQLTEAARIKAAELSRRIVDSLHRDKPDRKIITMGDLNDNPNNKSVRLLLRSKYNQQGQSSSLFNPLIQDFERGMGTLAYRDQWSLFDQWLLSKTFKSKQRGWQFTQSGILVLPELIQKKGRYKGYPFRTYVGTSYQGGYSDHLPIYLCLSWVESPKEYALRKPDSPGNTAKDKK